MAQATRKSRMAIVEETTKGTLEAPSSGSDYIALQSGFTLTPSFEVLENAELKSSIGRSKSVLGLEQPNGSLSHYLIASGTEATRSEMDLLVEGALGTTVDAPTETTVSSATTSDITVNSATGLERGQSFLIKDGTNGYSIRPIESLSGSVATLGFNLSNAPASSVALGRPILYKPSDDFIGLSVWDYRGNGGAVQAMAGAQISEMTIEAEAGQPINSTFNFEGTSFRFNPVEITSSTNALDFTADDGAQSITITAKFYKDPHDAAQALEDAMNAATTDTITVTYSDSTGKFTVASDGSTFEVDWATTTDTLGAAFGFTADDTGSTSYESDNAYALASPQSPSLDGQDFYVAKDNQIFLGDADDNTCFKAQSVNFTLSNEIVNVNEFCPESGLAEKVVNGRTVTVELTATLTAYDADQFKRFRQNDETRFFWAFGKKSGGNWLAGKCGSLYIPKCTISSFEVQDSDGIVTLAMTLSAYTESGEGEVFLNLL